MNLINIDNSNIHSKNMGRIRSKY